MTVREREVEGGVGGLKSIWNLVCVCEERERERERERALDMRSTEIEGV